MISNRFRIVKVLSSSKWKIKFDTIAESFAEHKKEIQLDLSLYVSRGIDKANSTLAGVDLSTKATNVKMDLLMKMIFEHFQSSEERNIQSVVSSMGGTEVVLKNEDLIREVYDKQKPRDWEGGKPMSAAEIKNEVKKMHEELKKDLDTVLAESTDMFDRKFGALRNRLVEVTKQQSDRVIKEVHEGPYAKRILDPVSVTSLPVNLCLV